MGLHRHDDNLSHVMRNNVVTSGHSALYLQYMKTLNIILFKRCLCPDAVI